MVSYFDTGSCIVKLAAGILPGSGPAKFACLSAARRTCHLYAGDVYGALEGEGFCRSCHLRSRFPLPYEAGTRDTCDCCRTIVRMNTEQSQCALRTFFSYRIHRLTFFFYRIHRLTSKTINIMTNIIHIIRRARYPPRVASNHTSPQLKRASGPLRWINLARAVMMRWH